MTETLGTELPDPLYAVLAAADPAEHVGTTLALLSVGEDGWPHQALLSVGEVLALDRDRLRLALWPASSAAANLAARGRATLTVVLAETSFTVRLAVRASGELSTPRAGTLALFEARVEEVRADVAPYAVLESGVRFRLNDPDEALARWAEVRAELRRHGDG